MKISTTLAILILGASASLCEAGFQDFQGNTWDLINGYVTCNGQPQNSNNTTNAHIGFARNAKGRIYSLHNDGTLYLWAGPGQAQALNNMPQNPHRELTCDLFGNVYSRHTDGTIYLWNNANPKTASALNNSNNPHDVLFHRNGRVYSHHQNDNVWYIWNGTNGQITNSP